jgi:hypothetical protein
MSLRDVSFWIGSAKADSLLKKLCREHAGPEAFDQLYRSLPDPWSTTADYYRYQLLKYQRALSLLPNRNNLQPRVMLEEYEYGLRGFYITQAEFASRIGVSQGHFSRIEHGGDGNGGADSTENEPRVWEIDRVAADRGRPEVDSRSEMRDAIRTTISRSRLSWNESDIQRFGFEVPSDGWNENIVRH